MENALLILHLVLVIFLIAVVLLQRSEGGALGMGGGGGGVMSGRGATTALQRVTWYLAAGFLATSLILTVIATTNSQDSSVFDATLEQPASDEVPEVNFAPPTIAGDEDAGAAVPDVPAGLTPAPAPSADPDNLVPAAPQE